MPATEEMFAGITGAALAERFEAYKSELGVSHRHHDDGHDAFVRGVGIIKGAGRAGRANQEKRLETIETLAKALTADQLAAIQSDLDALKSDVAKDWQQGFPETAGYGNQLAPYDLQGPAKLLVPRQTPLRNAVPRETGVGAAAEFRRILGWTNSGVGGVPDMMIGMNSEFPNPPPPNLPQFGGYSQGSGVPTGGLQLRRGQKINYAADSQVRKYVELSVSDSVTWRAQFMGQGFQDIRQLSHTAGLWAHLGGEERMMLYGRGATAVGYKGPLAQPGAPTASTAASGGTVAAGTYYFVITAIGGGGESVVSAQATVTTTGATSTITVTLPTPPTGALGWNIYGGTTNGSNYFYQVTLNVGLPTYTFTVPPASSGNLSPTADSSSGPNNYDGFLTILLDPSQSGYVKNYVAGATAATTFNSISGGTQIGGNTPPAQGDLPFQQLFQALYGAATLPGTLGASGQAYGNKLLGEPDIIYVDGTIRVALGQYVKTTGANTGFRIMYTQDQLGGGQVGFLVNGLVNQVRGKPCDIDTHPYMPPGCAFAWSKTLPVPDSEVSATFAARNVQDYMAYDWPAIQFTWDFSTYQLGTLVPYAPAWSGAVTGLIA